MSFALFKKVNVFTVLLSQVPSYDKGTKILRISTCNDGDMTCEICKTIKGGHKFLKTCLHRTRRRPRRRRRRRRRSSFYFKCIFKVEKGRKTVAEFINVKKFFYF